MTGYNVIIISLDGLRVDRLPLCTELSGILRKGYFFSNMITTAPYTLGSFHSIITGLYPQQHGVDAYFSMLKFKKDICKTLAQYLHDEGYYTEANLAYEHVLPTQGFDNFHVHDEYNEDQIKLHKDIITRAAGKKFFLFLWNNKLHTHTIANVGKKYSDFSKEFFNNYELNKKNYNSWLKELDLYVKEIFDHIKNLQLLDNTILIFLSDHGMSNGEKIGEKMYGSFTYDYTVRVFCSIILPNTKGKEINFQTRTIDIMPTIMDILKIDADETYEHIQGKSLLPLVEGSENEDRVAFSETGGLNGPWPSPRKHNVFSVRFKKWKLIYNKTPNTWEMYNLENDTEEKNDVFDNNKNKESTLKLQKMLLDHIKPNQEYSL